MKRSVLILLALVGIHVSVFAESEPRFNPTASMEGSRVVVRFDGTISPGDAKSIDQLYQLVVADAKKRGVLREKAPVLVMNSLGGSVSEAMTIGRWLRRLKGVAYVPEGNRCFSACVYVLAAGSERVVSGDVGIHRPFLTASVDEDYGLLMQKMLTQSRAYLYEMGISERLADEMFAIEPEFNKILTAEQLSWYRLNDMDVGRKEELAISEARRLGISRIEYNKRLARFFYELRKCDSTQNDEEFYLCSLQLKRVNGLH